MCVFLVLVSFVTLWCYQAGKAQPSAEKEEFKMAVVNVIKVLTECQENLDKEKEGLAKKKKIKEQMEKLALEADSIKLEMQNALEPDSKEYNKRMKDWFDKKFELKSLEEYQKEVLTVESEVWTKTLYEKLLEEIGNLARQKGLSLVLSKDETPLKERKLSELYNLILSRKVLYNSSTLDITEELHKRIDLAYEQEKASAAKP